MTLFHEQTVSYHLQQTPIAQLGQYLFSFDATAPSVTDET